MADTLHIVPAPAVGCEPEEAPAKRVIDMQAPVQLSGGLPDVEMRAGRPALSFPNATPAGLTINAPITAEMPAGEVAGALRRRCVRCQHFRRDLWLETKRVWAGAPERSSRRIGLDKMILEVTRMITDGVPGIPELRAGEMMLGSFGVCEARSEIAKDLVIVHPEACCPDDQDYYQDAGKEARREASKVFDRIMRMAQGRT